MLGMTTEAQRAVEDILEALSHDEDEGVVLYKIIVVLRKHGFVPRATTPSGLEQISGGRAQQRLRP